ncbi:MAG TPA: SDR family oxidoreductase [Acidobacteriaceae bacterium]|jgi:UDP-glucose 4-epimerase|nr:SDR family oxidoreductase [Acidobacteriaceae bacterium]
MAVYLVTGAAGFIGSWITHALVERSDTVRALDNFATGKRENLTGVQGKVEILEADLRDAEAMNKACVGVHAIFHQGALPSVPLSIKDPRTSHTANIDGTFNLLEAARAAGVQRIVYAASSSAYGNKNPLPQKESMPPGPISPYAVQKLVGELYLRSYWDVFGLETVALRYFNIFGPRQAPDSPYSGVMAKFIRMMIENDQPVIFGDGLQSRDFTYIENVVQANLKAAAAPAEKVSGRVFNIACGEPHTLNETYQLLAEMLNYKNPPQYGPPREGDIQHSYADISAAREALGYDPKVDFVEGLRRTVAWYREQHRVKATA